MSAGMVAVGDRSSIAPEISGELLQSCSRGSRWLRRRRYGRRTQPQQALLSVEGPKSHRLEADRHEPSLQLPARQVIDPAERLAVDAGRVVGAGIGDEHWQIV